MLQDQCLCLRFARKSFAERPMEGVMDVKLIANGNCAEKFAVTSLAKKFPASTRPRCMSQNPRWGTWIQSTLAQSVYNILFNIILAHNNTFAKRSPNLKFLDQNFECVLHIAPISQSLNKLPPPHLTKNANTWAMNYVILSSSLSVHPLGEFASYLCKKKKLLTHTTVWRPPVALPSFKFIKIFRFVGQL